MTWYEIGEPLLIHTEPTPERRYGVCTILIPALGARPVRERSRSDGPGMATGTGRKTVQHLRVGVLGKLDGVSVVVAPDLAHSTI